MTIGKKVKAKKKANIAKALGTGLNPKHALKTNKLHKKKRLVEKVARISAASLASGEERGNEVKEKTIHDGEEMKDMTTIVDAKAEQKEETQYLIPTASWFLHVGKKVLQVRIDLPKVPHKCINLAVKEKSLYVDTLKFTRKYKHEFPLYGGVTVDPSNVEAEHRGYILCVRVPVVDIPKETEERELQIVEAKRKAKSIKFPEEIKKSIVEAAERRAKKTEKRKQKNMEKRFYEQHLDLVEKKRKKSKKIK